MPVPVAKNKTSVGQALQTVLAAIGFVSLIFLVGTLTMGWMPEISRWFVEVDHASIAVWAGVAIVVAIVVEVIANSFIKTGLESKRAQERFLYMAEATGYASWEVDLSLNSIWWGVGAENVFGRASLKSETGVEFWEKHVHPEDKDRVNATCDEALNGTGSHWSDQYRIIRQDGEIAIVLDQGRIIRDPWGKAIRMIGGMLDITTSTRAFEALKESEQRFRDLAENLQDVFYNHDPVSGKMLYVNKMYERIWGRSVESLLENPISFFESVIPEDRDEFNKAYQRQLRGMPTIVEYRIKGPQERVFWIQDRSFPILDEQGKVRQIVGTARDITDAREKSLALEASETSLRETTRELEHKRARLVAAQAVAKIGSWELELGTMAVAWSKETFRVFEVDEDDPVPSLENIIEKIHPEDRAEVRRRLHESFQTVGCHIAEHRLLGSDGSTKYIEERWEVIGNENGNPIRIIGTCQDITVRRKSESEKRRLLAAIEQLDDAILIADPDGVIVYANGATEQMTGYAREHVVGSRSVHLGVPDDAAWSTIRQGFPWRGIQKATRIDGSTYFEECVVSPVHNQQGVLVNLIAVKKDISDRQQLESHYREAEKMTAVGQLAGGIAHDFNNMLTVVQVQAELAQLDAALPEKLRPAMEMIQQAAVRSADLTRELLTFARRQPNAPKVVDLGANLQSMSPMLRSMVGEDIEFEAIFPDGLWNVKIDVSQFDHMLANLCLNARDAVNGRGKISVVLSNITLTEPDVASGAPLGQYVRLIVSDSGSGMTADVLKHAFEPFFTTKSDGKGTGLGLAVVHGIVRQHGGFISLHSREGEGLVATVLLPRCTEVQDTEKAEQKIEMSSAGQKILLVDDEPMLLSTVQDMLLHLGYRVVATSDPREAMALYESELESEEFSLLLTDIVMPQMNGIDLFERVRVIDPKLNCLFMSGYSDRRLSGHLRANWPERILNKPFRLEELSAALKEAFNTSALIDRDLVEPVAQYAQSGKV